MTWLSPGLYARPNGGIYWGVQDMLVFSHEISEWANDPFVDNFVEPWPGVPGFPQYGCSNYLETGDPAGNAAFAMGTNTFRQGPNPNGTQSADGYYHPEDEVTLPWFMRLAPNLVSEPTQTPSPDVGRYTLMGSLDQFAGLGSGAAIVIDATHPRTLACLPRLLHLAEALSYRGATPETEHHAALA